MPADAASGAAEHKLALAAASGDGQAFAQLYDAYEKRIYNYCLRLLGDRHEAEDATQEAFLKVLRRLPEMKDRQFEFGPYLFTTARNTSYDMIGKHKKTEVMDEVPESGEGHMFKDGTDLDADPSRAAMLESQQELVREANGRLPERQREVLVLREVEGMSYDEIATTMEMKSNAVAQLISRARTNLRGEMRLGAASGITPGSAECERALPLLAARADAELKDPAERIWLETHLDGCEICRLSDEAMAEAGISYRAWAPVIPAAYLFRDTLAKAASITGSDWSGIERPAREGAGSGGAEGAVGADGAASSGKNGRSWKTLTGAAASAILLVAIVSAVVAGQVADSTIEPGSLEPVSAPVSLDDSEPDPGPVEKQKDGKGKKNKPGAEEVTETEIEVTEVVPGDTGGLAPSPGTQNGNGNGNGNGGNQSGNQPIGGPGINLPPAKPQPEPPVEPRPEPQPEPEPEPPVVPPVRPDPPTPPTPPTPGGPTFPIPR